MPCKIVTFPVREHSRRPVRYLWPYAVCSIQEVKLSKEKCDTKGACLQNDGYCFWYKMTETWTLHGKWLPGPVTQTNVNLLL